MNDKHTTPRGSAFHQPIALPKPEQAAKEAARQEAAREFATHGDPSLKKDATEGQDAQQQDRRVRVRWERPADVAMRAAAAGLGKGADLHLAVHRRLRALRVQARQDIAAQVRQLPAAVMARRQAGKESPGNTPISR